MLVPSLPMAVLLESVSEVGGALVVLTGAAAGSLRAWAVLAGYSGERIEWLTALGFVLGAMLTILIVFIDLAQELN